MNDAYYILSGTLLVATIIGFWVLMKKAGVPCQFCRNMRCTRFHHLDPSKQENILRYFREYEHREPDRSGVFVCEQCGTVFDDFSGEKRSWETDTSFDIVRCMTYCKVCNWFMVDCHLNTKEIRCKKCGTRYRWLKHEQSDLVFLMPPPGTDVLKRCRDYSMGTA